MDDSDERTVLKICFIMIRFECPSTTRTNENIEWIRVLIDEDRRRAVDVLEWYGN